MSGDKEKGPSQATTLAALALRHYQIIAAEDGTPYAVALEGPNLARPLRGRDGVRQRLARLYAASYRATPSGSALADALTVLEGMAADADREPVALRLARHGESIVIDLGTTDGRCVIVRPGQWVVADRSPVLFRRTALTGCLPKPVPGGTLDPLRKLVNADEATLRLLVGWLVAGLIPDLPHAILAVFGEQGTAKTTLLRTLAALLDPSPAPTRTAPRDVKQWAVTASASWLVCLDNVSSIQEWLSDALCRAVTGDALPDRALYTDADVSVVAFRRVVALSSIDAGALRGDLGDRLLPIELDRIEPTKRRRESELAAAATAAAPEVFGALLDLLADVLVELPNVRTTSLPRMADFAAVLTALDTATDWKTVADYAVTAADIAETVIDSDPVASALRALVPPGDTWSGTAAELLTTITPERPPRGWPRTPRAVSGAVRRVTPALRTVGITVEHGRTSDRSHTRTISLQAEPDDSGRDKPSEPSEPSEHGSDQRQRSDGTSDGRTVELQPSAQPSEPAHAADQQKHGFADGSDGSDGRMQHESTCCIGCGQPLLLHAVGRDTCERCRRAEATS